MLTVHLHCAVWDGEYHPFDVLARSWDEWVEWNRRRGMRDDFNRQFIISLARDRNKPSHWLFGGVFEVVGRRPIPGAGSYDVVRGDDLMGAFIKRLVVQFKPPGRAVRLNMETHLDQIQVVSILEQPYAGEAFPGHDQINDTLGVPEVAIKQDWHDWRESLHGNNIALRELVGEKGPDYARANLHFALLEFWSMRTADEDVLARHPAAGQRPAPVTTHPHQEAHLVSE